MKVDELIAILQQLDPDDTVILQRDAEGNGYSPLESWWTAIYVPLSTWAGEAYLRELTSEDRKDGFTDDDLYDGDDGVKAVILCPVN